MERFLLCPACMLKGDDRFFSEVGPGFEPHDSMESCQSLINEESDDQMDEVYRDKEEKHCLDKRQESLIGSYQQQPVSTLHEFLKDGIQTIEKTPFRELEGDLEIGDQIWIYRDGRTNPCNPVAVLMPYAHVAVFVGVEHGEKKVIHVEKASICLSGIITATIRKVNLNRVVNPDDQGTASFTSFLSICFLVFLGHKIPAIKHAFNTRDQIAARARALAEPPQLLFDYDHHDNCETFANLLIGAVDRSTQGERAHPCVTAICCLVNCFRSCRQRETLSDVLQKRLKDKGI